MPVTSSIQKAQQVARNILNLSQSELEDLISPVDPDQSTLSVCHHYQSPIIFVYFNLGNIRRRKIKYRIVCNKYLFLIGI